MGFVAAKCTQCGANIEVDDTKEAGICKYCGTAFVTEKAINNYVINNNYNIQNANIVMPSKNIDNLKKLGFEEYKNGKYETADDYFRQVLEMDGDDQEAKFMRYIVGVCEKNDYWTQTFEKQLKECLSYLNNRKERIELIFSCCEEMIMHVYCEERDLYLTTDKKIIVENGESKGILLNGVCNHAYQALFVLFDNMEEFINGDDKLKDLWITICYDIDIILDMRTAPRCGTDGLTYYTSESGAESIYEVAKKYKEYALKVNKNFKLNPKYISPKEGGEGIKRAKGCYIATCVYGSYDCPQVWTLRRFRDYTLDETWYGRLFIKCYYAISPTLVKWFGNTKWFRKFWKSKLDKMVADLNNKGVKDTYYNDKY